MGEVEEREIGGLTIKIDRLICVGFGDCIDVSPDAFEFDSEGIAVFTDEAGEVDRATLLEACERCPVDALIVLDEGGEQLVP